jgi:hypothetical protein
MTITSNYASVLSLTGSAASASASKTGSSTADAASSGSYLDQLKSKFGDLNISSGEYSGGATGSGTNNLLISPKLLAKAENDPAVAAKLENDISGIPDAEEWLKNQCAAQGMTLVAGGTMIDEDGNMSSWSQTTSTAPGASEDDDEEDKKIEKKKEEKKAQEARAKEKQEEAEKADDAANTPQAYYSEYDGLYQTLVSTSEIPYSLNVYA